MWGENWNEFFWGGGTTLGAPVATVPISGAALLILGIVIGAIGARLARRQSSRLLMMALVIGYPIAALAITLPHTFVNGTLADAEQVNANFDAIVTAIDDNPPLTSIDGLTGGTLSSDVVVTGSIQANAIKLPNAEIKASGGGIVVKHDSGPEIKITSTGIALKVNPASTLTLTPTEAALKSIATTVEGVSIATVKSPLTDVNGGTQLILKGGLVLIN